MSPSKYINSPIYFVPSPVLYLPPEEFKEITDKVVPGVKPYYMISNYGRIWHKYRQEFLTFNIDSKGYLYKPLATDNGSINCRIHRLVMMTFCYFPGCENRLINHKDGIKTNPCITNLEWSSYSENMIHAFENELVSKQNIYNDEQIKSICELLQNNKITLQEIADKVKVPYSLVQSIQGKRTHTDISDKYNIQPRKINNNLSIEEVEKLCKYYQDNPKNNLTLDQYCTQALLSIGINNTEYKFIKTAKKILNKETYTYISKDYNF